MQSVGFVWKNKLNLTQQENAFRSVNRKPALVTIYDIRPENGASLFSKKNIREE